MSLREKIYGKHYARLCCFSYAFCFFSWWFYKVDGLIKTVSHLCNYISNLNWAILFQCLLLLSYLIRNGSERVISSARDHIYDMRQLESYQHVDEFGKDQGLNGNNILFSKILMFFVSNIPDIFFIYQ